MLFGKSNFYVPQSLGSHFIPDKLEGYFNDLTRKVSFDPIYANEKSVPEVELRQGNVVFPVAVFQYALGCYDLFLDNRDNKFFKEFLFLSDWTVENQKDDGHFDNFESCLLSERISAMAQGEAASLLSRAYFATKEEKYLLAAKKSIEYMLDQSFQPNLSHIDDHGLTLYEYAGKPPVLNGWIFASYGLRDMFLATGEELYQRYFMMSVNRIKAELAHYDKGFWSMYDNCRKIASPFYHKLHIAQLKALYLTTGDQEFLNYCKKFEKYQKNPICRFRAFVKKAFQKLAE